MSCSNLSSFLLLFGCVRCVMTVNLTLLLSFTQFHWSDRELYCVCAYVSQVLPNFSNIIPVFGLTVRLMRFIYLIFLRFAKILGNFLENFDVLPEFIEYFWHILVTSAML